MYFLIAAPNYLQIAVIFLYEANNSVSISQYMRMFHESAGINGPII